MFIVRIGLVHSISPISDDRCLVHVDGYIMNKATYFNLQRTLLSSTLRCGRLLPLFGNKEVVLTSSCKQPVWLHQGLCDGVDWPYLNRGKGFVNNCANKLVNIFTLARTHFFCTKVEKNCLKYKGVFNSPSKLSESWEPGPRRWSHLNFLWNVSIKIWSAVHQSHSKAATTTNILTTHNRQVQKHNWYPSPGVFY